MSNEAIDSLRARVAELESEAKLRDQVQRLEARIRGGITPGSPAAMPTKQPKRAIGGSGSYSDELRREFIRTGGYEPL